MASIMAGSTPADDSAAFEDATASSVALRRGKERRAGGQQTAHRLFPKWSIIVAFSTFQLQFRHRHDLLSSVSLPQSTAVHPQASRYKCTSFASSCCCWNPMYTGEASRRPSRRPKSCDGAKRYRDAPQTNLACLPLITVCFVSIPHTRQGPAKGPERRPLCSHNEDSTGCHLGTQSSSLV